jgi:U3 small nucleolar RNA-associated protein 23
MKVRRAKTHKRSIAFYRHHFGFREPYQVLLDGTFLHAATRYQIDLATFLPRVFHGQVKMLITPCIIAELSMLGDEYKKTLAVVIRSWALLFGAFLLLLKDTY